MVVPQAGVGGSGNSGEIKIGEAVLNYATQIEQIMNKVSAAYSLAAENVELLNDGETYQGDALEEMLLFFSSLESNCQRMYLLYQTAMTYVLNAYQTNYYNDEQVVNWIIENIDK